MIKNKGILFLFILTALINLNGQNSGSYNKEILKSNLEFLASDALKGRASASEYEVIASEFIASELKKYGIEPYGDSGTYFQSFDVTKSRIKPESVIEIYDADDRKVDEFKVLNDFLCEISNFDRELHAKKSEMVFCGYGITSPENDYDDYKNLDVKDKIVLVNADIPSNKVFNFKVPEAMYNFYSPMLKGKIAFEHGAKAVIFLPNKMILKQWEMIKKLTTEEKFSITDDPTPFFLRIPIMALTEEAAGKLLESESLNFTELSDMASSGKKIEPFTLSKSVCLNFSFVKNKGICRNVVGILKGEKYTGQYITVGAHYDHFGVEGGEIYNGADDNASGVVAVLETARMLSQNSRIERAVIFIFYSGEEKGLFGSKYFANTFAEKEKIAVNINLDMVGRENADTLFARGALETSEELDKILKDEDESFAGLQITILEGLTNGMSSSDHTSFAHFGIPVIDFGDEMEADYHEPSDDFDKIDYDKIGKTSVFVKNLVMAVSKLDHQLIRN